MTLNLSVMSYLITITLREPMRHTVLEYLNKSYSTSNELQLSESFTYGYITDLLQDYYITLVTIYFKWGLSIVFYVV